MTAELLHIEPSEVTFFFESDSSCFVQLRNKVDQYIAFQVKTSPDKYRVRPITGLIKPNEKCVLTVTMLAQCTPPPDMQCKDSFIIQSTAVPFGTTEDDITSDMFPKDSGKYIEERKLKVVLISPSSSLSKKEKINKFLDLYDRQLGQLPARTFPRRLGGSEDLVLRLDAFRKLEGHTDYVNCLCFNAEGDTLVSGSGDERVLFWDWATGKTKLSFNSGHEGSVLQVKLMPYSNDRSIITSGPGTVRHAQIDESGGVVTKCLGGHIGVHVWGLAIEPGSPHIFYSCGQDELIKQFDLRVGESTQTFDFRREMFSWDPYGYYAIAIDPRNPNLMAVAGLNKYAWLYDIRNNSPINHFCPSHLVVDESEKEITGLAFSEQRELLVSYSRESIYLFTEDMGYGQEQHQPFPLSPILNSDDEIEDSPPVRSPSNMDDDEKMKPLVFEGHMNHESIKGVNFFGPNCEYVVSGSDCGGIFIWRKKDGKLVHVMQADQHVVRTIEPHPHTMVLASCGMAADIKIWTPNRHQDLDSEHPAAPSEHQESP